MTNLTHPIQTKYANAITAGPNLISRDAAMLAGMAALHDLDAIVTAQAESRLDSWRERHHDQTDTISDLESALDDAVLHIEMHRNGADLWRTQYELSQAQLSALEAECQQLKTTTNESSSPTTAPTALSEPAASITSKPQDPTPPSPAASSGESAAPAAPAPSAPTSKQPHPKAKNQPPPAEPTAAPSGRMTLEAGQTTSLDPTQSPHLHGAKTLLANTGDLNHQITLLAEKKDTWRHYSKPLRLAILAHLWQEQWSKIPAFNRTRPQWMPTAGAVVFLSPNARWTQIEAMIGALRSPPSVTNS